MPTRHPIEYNLEPRTIHMGMRWLTVTLKNIGDKELTNLDVRLNSRDTYSINALGEGTYHAALRPGAEEEFAFHVAANASGPVYVTIDGLEGGQPFHWETPDLEIGVHDEVAELVSLFALDAPARLGEPIQVEATIRGMSPSEGLILEFWCECPDGEFRSLVKRPTDYLEPGQKARYRFHITPEKEGIYILHAYLYDGARRIGHRTEYLSIAL